MLQIEEWFRRPQRRTERKTAPAAKPVTAAVHRSQETADESQEDVALQDSVAEAEELEHISEQIGQDVTDMIDMKREAYPASLSCIYSFFILYNFSPASKLPRLVVACSSEVYSMASVFSASVSTISSCRTFMERLILLSFVFKIFACTFSPSFKTSPGCLIRF